MGGYSAEAGISMKSAQVVYDSLNKELYEPYKVLIEKDRWALLHENEEYPVDKNDFSATVAGTKINFDAVFVAIHGSPGENGLLQAYFKLMGIPHTTSGHFESALAFNKGECNALLRQFGVKSAQVYFLAKNETYSAAKIVQRVGLPCFVKPNRSGSSFGVSKVYEEEQLHGAIKEAFKYDNQVLIETFIQGTEVSCGLINFQGQLKAFPLTEIVSHNDFFDYKAKYEGFSEEITPARISDAEVQKVHEEAKFIYESLNLNGIARIDFILKDDHPYLLEINTVPGFSEESILPKQAVAVGMSLSELFNQAVEHALKERA